MDPQTVASTFRTTLVLLPKMNSFIEEFADKFAQKFTDLLIDKFTEDFVG